MKRRQLGLLAALILLGALFAHLLKDARTVGRFVGDSPSASLILRDEDAPQVVYGDGNLTVVVFTDYQCQSCKGADSALQHAIERDGNITVIFKDWPILGERSLMAAKVALAAHRQDIYFSFHRLLMKSAQVDDQALRASVKSAGGDWEQVKADLQIHEAEIANQLAVNSRDAFALGLGGTPGYLVGPIIIKGALTEREFGRAFEQARNER